MWQIFFVRILWIFEPFLPHVTPRPSSSQFTLKTGKNHPVLPLLFGKMSEK